MYKDLILDQSTRLGLEIPINRGGVFKRKQANSFDKNQISKALEDSLGD